MAYELGKLDNQEAVKVGDLERYTDVTKVVRTSFFRAISPNAAFREEVCELTLRAGDAGMLRTFIDTTRVENGTWG